LTTTGQPESRAAAKGQRQLPARRIFRIGHSGGL
jgi:hypothetical protein